MAGIRAIEGVDNTLIRMATAAVAPLSPLPAVTFGPLDRDDDVLRVNWFLYDIRPNAAYRNMVPPRTGVTTARGIPPLSVELGYLLTGHPGTMTTAGQQAQFADRALASVMRTLHDNAIVSDGSPFLAAEATPLVEPLRITMETLDVDTLSKLWTSATRPMRTAVGYRVSLTVIDSTKAFVSGPPVLERRLAVLPSMGPRFAGLTPSRVAVGIDLDVGLLGASGQLRFGLYREVDDPPGPDEWPLAAKPLAGLGRLRLQILNSNFVPGPRQISVSAIVNGLPTERDWAGLTLVPIIRGLVPPGGPVAAGNTARLATAHVTPDVEVFFDGERLPDQSVTFISPTEVRVIVPPGATVGNPTLMLRSASTAGPTFNGLVVS
jgi:hypothetical protein